MRDNPPSTAEMRSEATHALSSLTLSPDGRTVTADFMLDGTLPIFEGHFPGMPVIPAVYQIALCADAAKAAGPFVLSAVVRSRFTRMCVPDTRYALKISLAEKDGGTEASCVIYNAEDNGACSKIVLRFDKVPESS
jgi:3-hydroxymyristoyl/3-hydroxydecanoyl-(acyl carrier protein) dehydratase